MMLIGILLLGLLTVAGIFTQSNENRCNLPPSTDNECNIQMVAKQLEKLETALRDIKELQRQLQEEKAMRIKLNEEILRIQENSKGPAFLATPGEFQALAKNDILKFDNVQLNRDEGYSSGTGVFTVPRSGVYAIFCTVRSNGGKHLHVWLCKNDVKLYLAYGGNWNTGSVQAVMNLSIGDQISIKHDDGAHVVDEEVLGDGASMFSAVFISE